MDIGESLHLALNNKIYPYQTGYIFTFNAHFHVYFHIYRKGDGLSIPPGWLCYLAPEIVRRLRPQQNRDQEELPFTAASDVYAFG